MNPIGAHIVVVLGMHRSGTSLITRGLQVLGVSLGDRLMPPSVGNNAKGFFEDIDINELNVALLAALGRDWQSLQPLNAADFDQLRRDGWAEKALAILRVKLRPGTVFGFKDPRTAKLLPFWQEVFRAGGLSVNYLLALRNPASIADSLSSRDGMPRERSYYLWLEHMLNSLAGTLESAAILVDYDDFFDNADRVLEQMAAGLGLAVDMAERDEFMNEFVDDALRHTVHTDDDLLSDPGCPPIVVDVYQGLRGALRDGTAVESPALHASLTHWIAEFERIRPALRLADGRPAAFSQAAPDMVALEVLKAVARQAPQLLRSVFDEQWYSQAYPDVANAGLDLFQHYSETGMHENRHPGPDVVQAAQQVIAALAQGHDAHPAGLAWLEQARRNAQCWTELLTLQRASEGRERSLSGEIAHMQRQLDEVLRQRAEHEAAWVTYEHRATKTAVGLMRQHAAELASVRQAGAAREQVLADQLQCVGRELHASLERSAEREAAWARQEHEGAQAVAELMRQHASELESIRQAGAAREQVLSEQLQRVGGDLHALLERSAEREAVWARQEFEVAQAAAELTRQHTARTDAMQREHADLIAALTKLADREQEQYRQQLEAVQARAETLSDQLTELKRTFLQHEAALQAAHTEEVARLQREWEETEALWRTKLARESTEAAAAREQAHEEWVGLVDELSVIRTELGRIHGSVLWRALAPFIRCRK